MSEITWITPWEVPFSPAGRRLPRRRTRRWDSARRGCGGPGFSSVRSGSWKSGLRDGRASAILQVPRGTSRKIDPGSRSWFSRETPGHSGTQLLHAHFMALAVDGQNHPPDGTSVRREPRDTAAAGAGEGDQPSLSTTGIQAAAHRVIFTPLTRASICCGKHGEQHRGFVIHGQAFVRALLR